MQIALQRFTGVIFLLIAATFCRAQELGYKIYTLKDGMVSNQIWYIQQDPKGYLWLASPEGCSRFDGKNFRNYTKTDGLSTTQTWDFAFYGDTMFILLNNKIDIRVVDKITNWTLPEEYHLRNHWFLHIDNRLSIVCFNEKTKTYGMLDVRSKQLNPAFDKVMPRYPDWFSISQIQGELFINSATTEVQNLFTIRKTKNGIWDTAGFNKVTYKNILHYEDVRLSKSFIHMPDKVSGHSPDEVFIFDEYKSQSLKIGENRHLMQCENHLYIHDHGKVTRMDVDFFLIFCIFRAADGTVWLATDRGLVKLFTKGIYNYPSSSGYLEGAWSLFPESNQKLWLGAFNKGVHCYENGKRIESIPKIRGVTFSPYNGSAKGFGNDMVIPTGNRCLFVYDFDKKNYRLIDCDSLEDCYFVWKDTLANRILTGKKVIHYLEADYQLHPIASIQSEANLQRINGATRRGDFYYFSSGNDVLEFNILTKGQRWLGFKDIRFNSIDCDYRQNLWGASDVGIWFMSPTDTLSWLNDKHIWALRLDHSKKLFAVSKDGLYVIDIADFYQTGKMRIVHFGEEEGFYGAGDQDAFFLDDIGRMWLPGISNNVVIHPDELDLSYRTIPVVIEKALVLKDTTSILLDNAKEAILAYSDKDIRFDYHAICLSSPSKVIYQYRLSGYDKTWSEPTRERDVRYTNLPPGKYVFEVRAAIYTDELETAPVSTFHFLIKSPFWFRWWFIAIAMVVLGVSILFAIKWRFRIIKRKYQSEQRLKQLELDVLRMQIKPHFIGNNLELIKSLIRTQEYQKAIDAINAFGKVLRKIAEMANRSSVCLTQELEMLAAFVGFQQLHEDIDFEYSVNVQEGLNTDDYEIPPLLLQPIVENAIIHGFSHEKHNGSIALCIFGQESEYLTIRIADNGAGRKQNNTERLTTSIGIKNTRERLEIFNKDKRDSLLINDLEHGTEVIIKLKIHL